MQHQRSLAEHDENVLISKLDEGLDDFLDENDIDGSDIDSEVRIFATHVGVIDVSVTLMVNACVDSELDELELGIYLSNYLTTETGTEAQVTVEKVPILVDGFCDGLSVLEDPRTEEDEEEEDMDGIGIFGDDCGEDEDIEDEDELDSDATEELLKDIEVDDIEFDEDTESDI